MYTGPHLIKDNLVFGYDTGYGVADNKTSTRFYPGEPTTNAVPLSTFINTSNWTGAGWSGTIAVSADYDNTLELTSTNGWRTWRVNTGITSGGTVTVSYEYKMKTLATTNVFMLNLNGDQLGSYVNSLGSISAADTQDLSNWKTFTGTFTANSNSNLAIGLRGADGQALTDTIYVRNLQVELKGQPSPFTATSRSSTQSLIDLKSTTDIDVSNVSFDSTGQPEFDGTNDEIQIASSDWNKVTEVTVEAVVLVKGTPIDGNNYHVVAQKDGAYSGGSVYGIRISGANVPYGVFSKDSTQAGTHIDTVAGTTMTTNKYYHLVYTRKVGQSVFYQNGEQKSINTSSNDVIYNNTSTFTIGQGDGRQLYGNIPVLKVHNRALTAGEVKQNYNAYKNRFDI